MATRALRARVINPDATLLAALKRSHRVYNVLLRHMVELYLAMRKGKRGETARQIAEIMLKGAKNAASRIMEGLTAKEWPSKKPDAPNSWWTLVRHRRKEEGLLLDRHDSIGTVDGRTVSPQPKHGTRKKVSDPSRLHVSSKFWRWLCDDACEVLKSNQGQMDNWRSEYKEWRNVKSQWEKDHTEFMAFWNGLYERFRQDCERKRIEAQQAKGQMPTLRKRGGRQWGKRFERWHLWPEWIEHHPEIVAWRGQATAGDFKPVPPQEKDALRKRFKRQDKLSKALLDKLREYNPELAALDDLRRRYEDDHERFRRAPTLTLPDPEKHPRWMSLERDCLYKDFDPEKGTIKLSLVGENADGVWYMDWFDAQVQVDPRLKPSFRREVFRREGRLPPFIEGRVGRKLSQPAQRAEERQSGIAGAKLIFKQGAAHLTFTIIDQDCPSRVKPRKVADRRCPADNIFDPQGERIPLRVLAVDLGVRHIGGYAVAEGHFENGAWSVQHLTKGILTGPQVPERFCIDAHHRQLKRARRLRGKPVFDEESCVELQDHVTHMGEDRFKKAAHAIIELSRQHDVHTILFENLKGFVPSARDERWANRMRIKMLRRKTVEMVKQQAGEFGFLCNEKISPRLTSHVCSKCFRPGWRFSMKAKQSWIEKKPRAQCRDFGYPAWDRGGHLFRCPHCGYGVNADINAAGNLVAKFFGLWPDEQLERKDWVYRWKENGEPRRFAAKAEFEKWSNGVRTRKEAVQFPY